MATQRSLISMLDPQAQASITGGKATTSKGTTFKPTAKDLVSGRDALLGRTMTNLQQAGADITQSANRAATSVASGGTGLLSVQPTQVAPVSGGGGVSGGAPRPVVAPTPTSTPSTPQTPETPQGPAGAGAGSAGAAQALAGYTEDEISAALAGLEAQFGMTRAQLLADQTQAGAQYRLLLAQLERGRVQGIETATNDAVRRNIYRSGILGENIAEIEGATLDQRRVAEEDLSARTTANDTQLRNLNAMQAAQAAQIEAQLRSQYARTLLEAGMSPGSVMSGGVAQPMPMPTQAPVMNTQGVGGAPAPNLLTTPVAAQQGAPQQAPPPVVTNPITSNPAPAYRDPREVALAYEQYIQMMNSGTNRFMPQPGTQYQPGGGYRIS